ncbi:MAG: TlpA family protein disulfide reductase [Sulfobacillus sp.]
MSKKMQSWLARTLIVLIVPLLMLFFLIRHFSVPNPVEVGGTAPAFALPTLQGAVFHMTDHPAKVTMINFFTTWCVPCQSEAPILARFADEHVKTVQLVMVDRWEGAALVHAFVKQYHLQHAAVVLDHSDTMAEPYGVTGQPETFGVNRRGIVTFHAIGSVTVSELDRYAAAMLQPS